MDLGARHPRPRAAVIEQVGVDHQSCPLLVLDGAFDWPEAQLSDATGRRFIQSGSPYEELAGYSRAVVDGDWIMVSGTIGQDFASGRR